MEVETDSRGYFAVERSDGVRWAEVLADQDIIDEAEWKASAALGSILSNDTCIYEKGPKVKIEILPPWAWTAYVGKSLCLDRVHHIKKT